MPADGSLMRQISDWLEGLPFQATTTIVAVLSGLLTTAVWTVSRRASVRWSTTLVSPFLVAAALYSVPVLFGGLSGASTAEYGSWAVLIIGEWGFVGCATSLLVASVLTLMTRRAGH